MTDHIMRQLSFLVPEEDPTVCPEVPEEIPPEPVKTLPPIPLTAEAIATYAVAPSDLETDEGETERVEPYDLDDPNLNDLEQIHEQGHPFPTGTLFSSPGGHFTYRVIGPCCRLFDREELPWPCCRLQWRGKEPSWRRIGRRFVLDTASRHSPSYNVEIVELGHHRETIVMTLYAVRLSNTLKNWWYAKARVET